MSLQDVSTVFRRLGMLHEARREPAAAYEAHGEALRWYERLFAEYGPPHADEAELTELREAARLAREAAQG
jgi:hypothetical protein